MSANRIVGKLLVGTLFISTLIAISSVAFAAESAWIEPLKGPDLNAFRQPHDKWQFVGEASLDTADPAKIATKPGTGVLVGNGGIPNIFTNVEHGDVELHIEFMVPKGSNSGVYFMGRYEIQVLDSWGKKEPKHDDCGGIYQRWDESRQGDPGFDGIAPRVNACKEPGQWQTYDVIFNAPRFDRDGRKTANAKFIKVVHNGIVIHENAEATGPTRAAAFNDEKPLGPLMLQGDHGPIAYRNLRIKLLAAPGSDKVDDALYNSILKYDFGQSRKDLIAVEEEIRTASPAKRKLIEDKLLAGLISDQATFAAKQFICRMLQQVGTEKSVPVLASLLTDEKLSHMARYALEPMPYPQVDVELRKALDKAPGETKIGIISSMGNRGDKKSVDSIAKNIKSEDKQLVSAAISSLGHIGGSEAAKILSDAKVPAGLEIARADACIKAADKLLAEGKKKDAAAIYGKMTADSYPAAIRISAYNGLINAEKENAVPTILKLLDDPNAAIRQSAGAFISAVPGPQATKAFADRLSSLSTKDQVILISGLAQRGDKAAAPQIAKAMKSADKDVQVAAVSAMGILGDSSSVKTLAEMTTESGDVSQAAIKSLTILSGNGVSEELIKSAQQGNPDVRSNCIDIIAARQDKNALTVLLKLAEDKDTKVRSAAYKALGSMAGPAELPKIVALLSANKEPEELRKLEQSLISIVNRIEDKGASGDAIIAGLKATGDSAKPALLTALSKVGNQNALSAVREYLASTNNEVKKAAIRTMSDWPDPAPMDDLLNIAKNDSDESNKILALRGYIKLATLPSDRPKNQTVEMLAKAVPLASRADEKKSILVALSGLPCLEALDLSKSIAADQSVAAEAKQTIDKLSALSLIAAGSKLNTSGGTDVPKINDGLAPKSPGESAPYFHWWPNKGTTEWVQYDFGRPLTVSAVEVYWFDDTGSGECRVPASWKVLYREDGQWKPVSASGTYGVEVKKFNKVAFEPVKTDALRLEVVLQPQWSSGIYEWKVE